MTTEYARELRSSVEYAKELFKCRLKNVILAEAKTFVEATRWHPFTVSVDFLKGAGEPEDLECCVRLNLEEEL